MVGTVKICTVKAAAYVKREKKKIAKNGQNRQKKKQSEGMRFC